MKRVWLVIGYLSAFAFASASAGERYVVPVLGDMHHDKMEYHDFENKFSDTKKNMKEIERYVPLTENDTPKLLAQVAKAIRPTTPFVIQLGDLTQGDCGSQALQEAMFDGALALAKQYIAVPFLTVKGNHDVRGTGAKAAYRGRIPPFLSQELGRPVEGTRFVVEQGPDVFIFFDCMEPDLDFLADALKNAENARYRFLVLHYPILPDAGKSNRVLFGDDTEKREKLLALLLPYEPIVLTGHLHRMALLDYAADGGRVTQIMVNSLADAQGGRFRNEQGLRDYSPAWAEETDPPEQRAHRRQLLAYYQPGVKRFYRVSGAGYAMLQIGPAGVYIDFHSGADPRPAKSMRVR